MSELAPVVQLERTDLEDGLKNYLICKLILIGCKTTPLIRLSASRKNWNGRFELELKPVLDRSR
ncbi:unnamed protein product, partial [Allacma fusca]